ncbi:MAG: acyl carrier protein [Acetatifactor sp.]|nr:acyl carrier protein [Acetatifactor sp.]
MFEKMRRIVAEQLGINENEITPDSSFKDDLGADSLDLFELVMNLEEEYAIEISTEDLTSLVTVGDVVAYLRAHGIEE